MKKYTGIILIASLLLLIFPFLGFPELWENIYVAVLGFVIAYTLLLLRHKISLVVPPEDHHESLQNFVQEVKEQFNEAQEEVKTSHISDISINE